MIVPVEADDLRLVKVTTTLDPYGDDDDTAGEEYEYSDSEE